MELKTSVDCMTWKTKPSQLKMFQESRQRAEDYAERVRTGKAADWKMTSAELLRYVQECNPGKVQAGPPEVGKDHCLDCMY